MAIFGLGKQQKTVGLDIGSGQIKLAVVDHSSGRPTLAQVAITPVLSDAIVEGEIMDPGVVADAIRGLFVSASVKQKKVVVAVGGRDVIVKKIQVDRMKESDAYDVVRWEAQQYVPFDIEGVELDFQVLDPEGEGLQMDVLLVAAKRELVESRRALLSDAGLEARIVDVDAFALHNAFEANYPDAMHGLAALINIGHEVTNVNVVQDGVPILTRDLSIGTRKFREDLQRERGMSAEDADALLQGFERTEALNSSVQNRGEEIAVGVERAAAFLQTASRDAGSIERVYCSGGGARIPGLTDVIGERLRIPTELANPLQAIEVKAGAFDGLNVDEVAPLLMQAIGLGLRRD
ncbi:MAG TPA: type IV pilus assembly protein PilM [Gemmatimonadales bacterium]|nr:type IV pilus assembly protein PilM [Gemmatimonadales bacterium]